MPSINPTVSYIATSNRNDHQEDALIDATVIANYGDPGLTEDYQFDILSRYVICMIESSNRVLTNNRYNNMIVIVQRPPALWINYQGGIAASTSAQQRVDANLNVAIGQAGNFSSSNIAPINVPYNMGDTIKIKLLKDSNYLSLLTANTFFQSVDTRWTTLQQSYGTWHTQGAAIPYISQQSNGSNSLRVKTITPYGSGTQNPNSNNSFFYFCLNKAQYEAFVLNQYPNQTNSLVNLFTNKSNFAAYYSQNGGYAYQQQTTFNFPIVMYEDVNIGLKARTSVTNCIPLIVTSPSNFTVPSARASGTVNYNPTYVIRSS